MIWKPLSGRPIFFAAKSHSIDLWIASHLLLNLSNVCRFTDKSTNVTGRIVFCHFDGTEQTEADCNLLNCINRFVFLTFYLGFSVVTCQTILIYYYYYLYFASFFGLNFRFSVVWGVISLWNNIYSKRLMFIRAMPAGAVSARINASLIYNRQWRFLPTITSRLGNGVFMETRPFRGINIEKCFIERFPLLNAPFSENGFVRCHGQLGEVGWRKQVNASHDKAPSYRSHNTFPSLHSGTRVPLRVHIRNLTENNNSDQTN